MDLRHATLCLSQDTNQKSIRSYSKTDGTKMQAMSKVLSNIITTNTGNGKFKHVQDEIVTLYWRSRNDYDMKNCNESNYSFAWIFKFHHST